MKNDFLMDISEKSYSKSHTPSIFSQRLPFYIDGCGHFLANSSYFTKREGMDSYLLIYTLSGSGYLEYNNSVYNLGPEQAVVFYCFEPQFYKTFSQTPWEFLWIHFQGTAVKEFYELLNEDSLQVISIGENQDIRNGFAEIFSILSEENTLIDIRINSVLTKIMTQIAICKQSNLNNRMYYQHKVEIETVITFIQNNYNKKISIDDFISLVHISKFYFLRLFKSYLGMSPYEYLINYRINISKSYLKDTSMTVNEICLNTGFNDINNFIRYFKRFVGTTPSNYRKNWNSQSLGRPSSEI